VISEKLNSIVRDLNENGVIISFTGSFTQTIIEEIGEAIRNYIEQDKNEDKNEDKNGENHEIKSYEVFSIYIEQSQNIKNYFYKKNNFSKKDDFFRLAFESIIVIGKEKNAYYVCSGNIIDNDDIKELKENIEYINSLDNAQLKKHYKEKLRASKSNDIGAGLGLIDMARKSSGPLKYLFAERDKKYSFFILKVTI
jgi:hypothetical protein